MLSANSVAENHGCRVLLQRAPKGTPSSTLTLRLRRCFHRQERRHPHMLYNSCLHSSQNTSRLSRFIQDINSAPSFRYATAHSPPPTSSLSHNAVLHLQSLLARSDINVLRSDEPCRDSDTSNGLSRGHSSSNANLVLIEPFRETLLAMRAGDTRRVLKQFNVIQKMGQEELRDSVLALPRTTLTEFFRMLDPLRIARDCDRIGENPVSVAMYLILNMTSSVDEFGQRKLYTALMRCLLILTRAMQDAGYTLHLEEYILLIRCAGASSDLAIAGALWNDVSGSASPLLPWRNSELYFEYIKARFLTEPLYTSYEKTRRMVTPRNLHRSRLMLPVPAVQRLDILRASVRSRRLRFGLNRDKLHVEELMRTLRGHAAAKKLFRTVVELRSFRVDEPLLCALMIALGRAGSLRFVGTEILQRYFGIRSPHPLPGQQPSDLERPPPASIRPSVRLMRAVVETYGSNAEIGVAVQLVEHLSNTWNIPIPRDVWQDLLEWTHVMSTPPVSTAWILARLSFKIPSPQAVEMIWDAMTSPPYNQTATFQNYNILIRSLIGRRGDDLTPVLSRMREAVRLYETQCREYEAAAFEYTLYQRADIVPSKVIDRFERARHKKQMMWFDIMMWCRSLLRGLPLSKVNPLPPPFVPQFIEEFRPFFKNPIEYLTPTGRISLRDPAIETFGAQTTGVIQQTMTMRNRRGEFYDRRFRRAKRELLSSHSLANFKASERKDPLHLLAPHKWAFVSDSIVEKMIPTEVNGEAAPRLDSQ
ncbi:mitochondrial ATPase expression-domain-containing protein [Xylaria venustula]|nr:mitochondrial ATPase expression-domain-containing protein [Xylaria venustula]